MHLLHERAHAHTPAEHFLFFHRKSVSPDGVCAFFCHLQLLEGKLQLWLGAKKGRGLSVRRSEARLVGRGRGDSAVSVIEFAASADRQQPASVSPLRSPLGDQGI